MSEPIRRKRQPPARPFLQHRAHRPVTLLSEGCTLRDLHAETPWGLSVQAFELQPQARMAASNEPQHELIWQIMAGSGLMNLGDDEFAVVPGDIIYIRSEAAFAIRCLSATPLEIHCIRHARGLISHQP